MHVLFTYPNGCITLKIQLLHLKSDFIMLKSGEGLAAVVKVWVRVLIL